MLLQRTRRSLIKSFYSGRDDGESRGENLTVEIR